MSDRNNVAATAAGGGLTLQSLQGNVYVLPGDMRRVRPWLGVVITADGVVVVDSGNSPRHARDLQDALRALDAPPVSHVLLTHHHWDHVFGNCAFPRAHIVAQEQTQYHLQVMEGEPWSEQYVMAKGKAEGGSPAVAQRMLAAVDGWDAFRAVPADETFDDEYRLRLGKSRLLMEHVGGQHEPDQCIVHVQPANVIFLGDATYGRGSPSSWDREALAQTLSGFLARGADYYVEGHRAPATREQFRQRIRELLQ